MFSNWAVVSMTLVSLSLRKYSSIEAGWSGLKGTTVKKKKKHFFKLLKTITIKYVQEKDFVKILYIYLGYWPLEFILRKICFDENHKEK